MSDHDHEGERQDNLRPEAENQAAVTRNARGEPSDAPAESSAGVDRDTGTGTGGATESDGRPGHHEGVHLGNQPNS
jgi:hypothetical protein